jgi:hypothetical protein
MKWCSALLFALAGCSGVGDGQPPADAAFVDLAIADLAFVDLARPDNGCGASLDDDPRNCGACGQVCQNVANGTPGCAGGQCGVGSCLPNFADCDGNGLNGCEASVLSDPAHCGACGHACGAVPHGAPACAGGACAIGACDPGYRDCNGLRADGCEVHVASDLANCGACGQACLFPHGGSMCVNSVCVGGPCAASFADCDKMAANGCETATGSDADNCGACGHVCSAPSSTSACNGGACAIGACLAGFADCDGQYPNGCEIHTDTDLANCGACGNACGAVANGTPDCRAGACAIGACDAGFFDCDRVVQTGCELDGRSDPANCGGCGKVCAVAHASPSCTAGQCGIASCDGAFRDCDGNPANGCEIDTDNDAQSCGGCGKACSLANAVANCANATCGVASCKAGFGDCDGNPANGCELDTSADVKNCGGCGAACARGMACLGGACKNGLAVASFAAQLTQATGKGPYAPAIADVNADGRADVVVSHYLDNTLGAYLATGPGTFNAPIKRATSAGPRDLLSADFNGDGWPDVAVNAPSAAVVTVCGGAGDGTFTVSNLASGNSLYGIVGGDFNGDGNIDLVVASYAGNAFYYHRGNGDGTFAAGASHFAWSPTGLATGDWNQDGRLDLAVIDGPDNLVLIHSGNGDGTFLLTYTYAIGRVSTNVAAADFNNDVKVDLAVPAAGEGAVAILFGFGNGFKPMVKVALAGLPSTPATADFNLDGMADLAVTAGNGDAFVSVLISNGDGTFRAPIKLATAAGGTGIATGDLNGDGRPDIVTTNYQANTISILLNTSQ